MRKRRTGNRKLVSKIDQVGWSDSPQGTLGAGSLLFRGSETRLKQRLHSNGKNELATEEIKTDQPSRGLDELAGSVDPSGRV
jgi:hypothetical protein